jgi:4-amino-4-deoxy-L-arabinose transferase-like glycosyltransferase
MKLYFPQFAQTLKAHIWIILILLLAVILRFWGGNAPPSLNWDEASLGYNAYSILKTGKDEWGRFLPLTFEAFGDYKLPGYIYVLVPFIAIFGLNEFSVRLPSIIFGSVAIVFLYLIVLELSREKKWALLSAIFLAISPWHFFLSRIALEANLASSFFLIGLYFLIKGLHRNGLFIAAALMLGLSIFTYNSARIFVPLFLFGFLILFWKQIKITKSVIFSAIIFGIFLTVGFYLAVFQDSSARYYWVRILDEGAISFLDQARNTSTYPDLITKLIYNRPVYFVFNFVANYFKHLSPQFLLFTGGSNYQFSLPGMGLIYFIELPFLIYGFFKLLKQKIGWVFIFWFLLAPIPSALTREAPHALRSIFMVGSIQVVVTFGLIQFFRLLEKKKLLKNLSLLMIGMLVLFNAFTYFKNYFLEYPKEYSQAWQYGYKQAIEEVNSDYDKYPKIYFTKYYGEPHIFYLFFSKYDPQKYQNNETLLRDSHTNWRWVDRLDKIYFINDWEMVEKMKSEENALVIASPGNVPENGKKLETIYFLDGKEAFEIFEI